MTQREQTLTHGVGYVGVSADTDLKSAKIGVTDWDIGTQITRAVTVRAVRVTGQVVNNLNRR